MKFVCLIAFLVFVLRATALRPPKPDGRIVGGKAADIENFPYQVSVRRNGNHTCGASIISDKWALTASHCVDSYKPTDFVIVAGTSFRTTGGTKHPVKQIVMHPKYNRSNTDYDYALFEVNLRFPVGSAQVRIVKLAEKPTTVGTLTNVTGWGTTSGGATALPDKLRQVQLPVVNKEICKKNHTGYEVTDRMLCAGYPEGGKDTCLGDSGGPMVVRGVQIGIVSWGYGCALPNKPGVYSDVAKVFSWIKQTAGL